MLLAARALGLGASLTTTLYLQFEKEAEAALVRFAADRLLPHGPVRRIALSDVSMKIDGASLTAICSDPEHPA
jgi:hypothetical protein